MASESPSPELNKLITNLKSSIFSVDTQNITKTLLDTEQRLKNQNLDLIKKTQVLEKENKKLTDLLKKREKKIGTLQRENEEMEDDVKDMVEEIQGLKKVNEALKKKVRVYEKRVLDFDARVSGLEKLGKELVGSAEFSDKRKNGVLGCVAETSIQHRSSGKEESKQGNDFSDKRKNHVFGCVAETSIQHRSSKKEESKQGTDQKVPETIHIDDDDEDDLKCVPSSKRQSSTEIKREHDSDDDRCISILIKKPGTKEIPNECNNDHANKIPPGTTTTTTTRRMPKIQTGIQKITSHLVSPFLDSDSDEENIMETYETIVDKQKERQESADIRIESESRRKQIPGEKGETLGRTNNKFPNIIQLDDSEDKDKIDQKDVSALKRKRGLSNVKVEIDSDDERCVTILRRKPVSKELQTDCKNDHVNILPTGGQRFFVLGSDKVKVEEADVPVIEKHTERWDTEAEMLINFSQSYELCMNAVCALHRQNIPVGDYLKPRIHQLAEWLIDGDPERKLKKTPSEINPFELDQCRMLAVTYSAELFEVYQKNADRFFPPRS